MAEPDAVLGTGRYGQGEDKVVNRMHNMAGILAENVVNSGIECPDHGLAAVEDLISADLCHSVVAEQIVQLVGKLGLYFGGAGEQAVSVALIGTGRFGTVQEFVYDEMTIWVILQLCQTNKLLESGRYGLAGGNVIGSCVLGLAMVVAGMKVTGLVLSR